MRNVLESQDVLNISYRVWAPEKFYFLEKWPNLQGRLELIWRSFFAGMIFFLRCSVFEIWSILYFFLQDLTEILIKYIYFLSEWLRPLHRFCPGAGCLKIDTKSEHVSVNGIFCKARLCCFPVKHSSPRLLLSNVKYKTENNAKTKNRTKKTHEFKKSDQNNAHLLFFHLGKNLGIF